MTASSSNTDTAKVALEMAPQQWPAKKVVVDGVDFPRSTPVKVAKATADKMLDRKDERGHPFVVKAKS